MQCKDAYSGNRIPFGNIAFVIAFENIAFVIVLTTVSRIVFLRHWHRVFRARASAFWHGATSPWDIKRACGHTGGGRVFDFESSTLPRNIHFTTVRYYCRLWTSVKVVIIKTPDMPGELSLWCYWRIKNKTSHIWCQASRIRIIVHREECLAIDLFKDLYLNTMGVRLGSLRDFAMFCPEMWLYMLCAKTGLIVLCSADTKGFSQQAFLSLEPRPFVRFLRLCLLTIKVIHEGKANKLLLYTIPTVG